MNPTSPNQKTDQTPHTYFVAIFQVWLEQIERRLIPTQYA
jgi:hypothetical protein